MTDAVYPTPDDLSALPFGDRLRAFRERRRLHQAPLAALAGISVVSLRRLEAGDSPYPRLDQAARLASALHLSGVDELVGDSVPVGALRPTGRVQVDVVPLIREAVLETRLAPSDSEPVDPDRYAADTEHAWRVWHRSARPRTDAGRLLPALIRDGRHAARTLDGKPRRKVNAALVGVYGLAEQVLAWVSDIELMSMVAERCMTAAEQADRPVSLAAGAWVVGNVRRTRDEEGAYLLAVEACGLLEPSLPDGGDDLRALWGACQLHSAISASRMSREGDALRALDQAAELARRMPEGWYHPWTLFSPVNTTLTDLTVHAELRKSRTALQTAGAIDPDTVPWPDRCARMYVETSRACIQSQDYGGALHALTRAADTAEESVRVHPIPRGLVRDLVHDAGSMYRKEAVQLATRLDVAV